MSPEIKAFAHRNGLKEGDQIPHELIDEYQALLEAARSPEEKLISALATVDYWVESWRKAEADWLLEKLRADDLEKRLAEVEQRIRRMKPEFPGPRRAPFPLAAIHRAAWEPAA